MTVLFCNQGLIFNTIELQAKWVARVLSGKVALPNEEEMMASTGDLYRQMQEHGLPKRSTYFLTPYQVLSPFFCNLIHIYGHLTFLYLNLYRPLLLNGTIKICHDYLTVYVYIAIPVTY